MITKENITAFISHLYYKRKGTLPPTQLLDGWRALSNEEINEQLNGLFRSWGLSELHKREEIKLFLQPAPASPAPALPQAAPPIYSSPTSKTANATLPPTKRKKRAWIKWAVILPLLLVAGFVGYQYFRFSSLEWIYAITSNISVRNSQQEIIARMDMEEQRGTTPSYQKMKAYNNEVYYRPIDSTGITYPCRKVLLDEDDFWGFVLESEDNVGYVNTNYVVDNTNEYNLYKTVFSDVAKNKNENKLLKAVYRRIIIGSMNKSGNLYNQYLVLHDYGLSKDAINKTTPILKESKEDNISYNIYAGLSDNQYYRFDGDIRSNVYRAPEALLFYMEDEAEEPLKGNYRFYTKGKEVLLYDCSEKKFTDHFAVRDGSGRITGFQYVAPPPPPDFFDRVDSALHEIVDPLFGGE